MPLYAAAEGGCYQMMISTKGRYALRVMIDLADHNTGKYIPLKDIAARQDISQKYLESIVGILSKAGFVSGQHGKGGGYKLARTPDSYTVGSILKLSEGSLAPVSCLEAGENACKQAAECRTLPLWTELYRMIDTFLEGVTLADLANQADGGNYVI